MYNMAWSSRNGGLFAWYRALNLSFILDIGRSFISVDDTVTLLFDIETDTVHYSTTCHIFIESVLACYHARKALGLQQHHAKHSTPSNLMKWRDAQQLVYRSINKAITDIRNLPKTSMNFFRVKAMLYLLEAMIVLNEISEKIDEDLSPKIKCLQEKVQECHMDKRYPVLNARWLIIQSLITKKNHYEEAKKSATSYENKLDYEWASLLGLIYQKKYGFMSLKTSGHPSTPYEWLSYVRVNGLMDGDEKLTQDKQSSITGSAVSRLLDTDCVRDTAPIHFFPFILMPSN